MSKLAKGLLDPEDSVHKSQVGPTVCQFTSSLHFDELRLELRDAGGLLGPNSIGKFWFEFWLEKPLEFWLEIPYSKKMFKIG